MKKNIIIPFACLVFANLFSHTVLAGGGGTPPPEYQWCIKNTTTNEKIKYSAITFWWRTVSKSGWIGLNGRSCFTYTKKPMYRIRIMSDKAKWRSCVHANVDPGEYKVTTSSINRGKSCLK